MGQFVPSGLHLMAGEAVCKGLLHQQNTWLDCMSVVIIEGLSYDATYVLVKFRGKMILLQTIMLHEDLYGFQQLEATTTVDTEGKWF
eukprot:14118376-Ditylum_brightwellii.AAC.1